MLNAKGRSAASEPVPVWYVDLPLEQITKAIDLVATRSNLGRVVLRTRCVGGGAELCGQEFQNSLVDVGRALDHHEVPDAVDQLGL